MVFMLFPKAGFLAPLESPAFLMGLADAAATSPNPASANAEIEKLKQQIAANEAKIKELEEQAASYQKTIEEKRGQANTLVNNILILDSQRKKLNTEIEIIENQIAETETSIEKLTLEIKTKEADIETLKKRVEIILRTIRSYDEVDLAELLLSGNNFSAIFNVSEAVQTLQAEIQEKLEDIKLLKAKLEADRQDLTSKKEDLGDLNDDYHYKKVIVEGEQKKKQNLLNVTKGQEKKFQNLLADTEAKQKDIQKEIYNLESKLQYLIDSTKVPAAKKGLLAWPCEGVITQGYGSTSQTGFINDFYTFHNGIDIAASLGTPIKAALSGKVIASGTNGNYAYGNWLAIDHQNGLITLYAHLSTKKVKVGEEVKKGQILGYMGSTGFSTGSHLHFTVYAASTFETQEKWFGLLPLGGSLNPMNYL